MAEIRCPNCNRLNPAEAEVCLFCNAELNPPTFSSAQPGDDEFNWFSELQSNLQDDEPSPAQTPESDESSNEVPDWLARIRDRARSETSTPSSLFDTGQEDSDEPDWLSRLQDSDSSGSTAQEAGKDDWMAQLSNEAGESSPGAPDWLSGLEPKPDQEPAEAGSGDLFEAGAPDWLSELEPKPDQEPAEAGSGDLFEAGAPDWLSGLEPEPGKEPASPSPLPSSDSEALPDFEPFIFDEPATPASTTNQEEDLTQSTSLWQTGSESTGKPQDSGPFWAADPFSAAESAPETPPFVEPASPTEEVPDWLKSFELPLDESQAQEPSEEISGWSGLTNLSSEEEQTPPISPAEETDVPDWLRAAAAPAVDAFLQADHDRTPAEVGSDQEAALSPGNQEQEEDEGAVPDWLAKSFEGAEAPDFSQNEALPGTSPSKEPGPTPDTLLPDWLSMEQPGPAAEEAPIETTSAQPFSGESDLADWLSSLDETQPATQPGAEPQGAVPAWLNEMETFTEQPESEPSLAAAETEPVEASLAEPAPAASSTSPFVEDSLPEWLSEFKAGGEDQPPAVPALSTIDSLPTINNKPFDVDLPEWLNEENVQEQTGREDLVGALADETGSLEPLAREDLPSWVQAMRPVETVMSDEAGMVDSEQHIEKLGPLAGMKGVLPAEESVLQYRKPPVYSAKLRVSEKQRSQMNALDNVLAREVQPKAVPQTASQAPWIIQRVIVALLLLSFLAGTLILNFQFFPAPNLVPQEIVNLHKQVDSLRPDDTVLLAIDYEPGLSGEMRFASMPILNHLIEKQVGIVVVSTVSTGPALANELITTVSLPHGDYMSQGKYENLGYLPGGTISLLEFARNPKRAAPRNLNGIDAWETSPILANVHTIQDFDRVIVLTDRAEAGRAWVEQVQPLLGQIPLLMVSSAQAGPLLQPYVNSDQVQGLASGVMGGTMYGQWAGSNDPKTAPLRYWGAYQAGLLLAFGLILIGGLFSLITGSSKPKQKRRA